MTTLNLNTNISLQSIRAYEKFSLFVKDAVVSTLPEGESLTKIRLHNSTVTYREYRDDNKRGIATSNDTIEVTEKESALQLAGTIIHELAHVAVGVNAQHNDDWHAACVTLGLTTVQARGQEYTEEHFSPTVLTAIKRALELFAEENPEFIAIEVDTIPAPDGCEYMPFQIDGIKEILRRPSVLLADEMGLGKTIQYLGYMNVAKPATVCIVVPKVATLNHEREARKWLLPEYLAETFDDEIEIASADFCSGAPFTIINYESLVRWQHLICRKRWDLVVLDEAHMIKTADAQRSKAARALCLRADKVIVMTGSPILNYPRELYPVVSPVVKKYPDIERIWPQISSAEPFLYRYTWGRNNNNLRHGDELQRMLRSTFMIRRMKREVLKDLPRKRRQIIEFKLDEDDDETRKLLEYEKKLFAGKDRSIDDVLESLVLEAASAGVNASEIAETAVDWDALVESMKFTKKFFFEEISRVRHLTAVAKVPYVIDHIETVLDGGSENGETQLVVFAHHKDVMRQLLDYFTKKGITSCLVDGSTDILKRQEYIDAFQRGEIRLFIGGIKAVGVAVTLTRASHCVFVETDWSPPIITQAEDRLHRIGQDQSVLIQHLVLEDSMDAFIAKKVMNKQKQIERVLNK